MSIQIPAGDNGLYIGLKSQNMCFSLKIEKLKFGIMTELGKKNRFSRYFVLKTFYLSIPPKEGPLSKHYINLLLQVLKILKIKLPTVLRIRLNLCKRSELIIIELLSNTFKVSNLF